MRKLFRHVAITCCLPLALIVAPKPAIGKEQPKTGTTYYFYSVKTFINQITRTGAFNLLVIDGQRVVYTDINTSGKLPCDDAALIALRYADKSYPSETCIVDRPLHAQYRQTLGVPKTVLRALTKVKAKPVREDQTKSGPIPNKSFG